MQRLDKSINTQLSTKVLRAVVVDLANELEASCDRVEVREAARIAMAERPPFSSQEKYKFGNARTKAQGWRQLAAVQSDQAVLPHLVCVVFENRKHLGLSGDTAPDQLSSQGWDNLVRDLTDQFRYLVGMPETDPNQVSELATKAKLQSPSKVPQPNRLAA